MYTISTEEFFTEFEHPEHELYFSPTVSLSVDSVLPGAYVNVRYLDKQKSLHLVPWSVFRCYRS